MTTVGSTLLRYAGLIARACTQRQFRVAYVRELFRRLWRSLPAWRRDSRAGVWIGKMIYSQVRHLQPREFSEYTEFLRNRPQLEILRALAEERNCREPLRLIVLGCSHGAELYSAVWAIREGRREFPMSAIGVDISNGAIEAARAGRYAADSRLVMKLSDLEKKALFSLDGEWLRVKDWIRDGATFSAGDAFCDESPVKPGSQDIVIVNNVLIHMDDRGAEKCLVRACGLLAEKGFIFCHGVALSIRSRVVCRLGLVPVLDRMEDIYEADLKARGVWPLQYWGLEPISKRRHDWRIRYCSVFQNPSQNNASAVTIG